MPKCLMFLARQVSWVSSMLPAWSQIVIASAVRIGMSVVRSVPGVMVRWALRWWSIQTWRVQPVYSMGCSGPYGPRHLQVILRAIWWLLWWNHSLRYSLSYWVRVMVLGGGRAFSFVCACSIVIMWCSGRCGGRDWWFSLGFGVWVIW